MSAEVLPEVTFEEFLAGEREGAQRHEWTAGEVFAMAGGSERHDLMTGLVYEALAPAARRRGCRPFQQNRLVRLGDAAYYPDVVVVCPGRAPDRLFERDLSLVVEVLSASTARVDRTEKAAAYSRAPSFQAYVLVDPERRRIEVGELYDGVLRWRVYGHGDVPALGTTVEQFYDQLDATAAT